MANNYHSRRALLVALRKTHRCLLEEGPGRGSYLSGAPLPYDTSIHIIRVIFTSNKQLFDSGNRAQNACHFVRHDNRFITFATS